MASSANEAPRDRALSSPREPAEACPAFAEGCPYANSACVTDWLKTKKPEEAGLCPGFGDGCPFKAVANLEALRSALQQLPISHGGKPGENDAGSSEELCQACGPAHTTLVEMLQMVHRASLNLKESIGEDCPVFQVACPFKNCVTSGGVPLLQALETRTWGLFIHNSHSEDDDEEGAEAPTSPRAPSEPSTSATAPPTPPGEVNGVPVPASVPAPPVEGLAEKLKMGTTEAHKEAETVHFVREFIKGKVPRAIYGQMVVNLYYVYEAMEEALEGCSEHPLIEDLHFPDELNRKETLARDAEFFLGEDWQAQYLPSPVTTEYVARLSEIRAKSPELLIPHAYTRYLGDLSGGQLLKKAAQRGLKLPDDGSGVQFYIFRRIKDNKKFKNMYRARLDNLKADARTADRMVAEANVAFGLNTKMFKELDRLMGFDVDVRPSDSFAPVEAGPVEVPPAIASAAAAAAAGACPFAALAAAGVPMPSDHPDFDHLSEAPKSKERQQEEQPQEATNVQELTTSPDLVARVKEGASEMARSTVVRALGCAVWAVSVAYASGHL